MGTGQRDKISDMTLESSSSFLACNSRIA